MSYFMNRVNVDTYKEMLGDYDNSWVVNKLSEFISDGAKVLELGMGTGLDLDLLSKKYEVIGSDNSPIFINDYNIKNKGGKAILLDAINVDINDSFDCIYSNKVLQHLTKDQFLKSLINQAKCLNVNGIIYLTLWNGEYREELYFDDSLRFTYYTENDIKDMVVDNFDIIHINRYTESDAMDSLLVVLKIKNKI